MQALRDDFEKRYPGDAINSDEANAEWSKAYKELRESPEAKQMEEQEAKLVREIRPYLADTHGDWRSQLRLSEAPRLRVAVHSEIAAGVP